MIALKEATSDQQERECSLSIQGVHAVLLNSKEQGTAVHTPLSFFSALLHTAPLTLFLLSGRTVFWRFYCSRPAHATTAPARSRPGLQPACVDHHDSCLQVVSLPRESLLLRHALGHAAGWAYLLSPAGHGLGPGGWTVASARAPSPLTLSLCTKQKYKTQRENL